LEKQILEKKAKKVAILKSILRYPGGKSKVAHKIVSLIPPTIKEFREPMVGGGSVSLLLKQTLPHVKVWINDLNYDLVCFWKTLRDQPEELIKELKRIKSVFKDGRRLFEEFSCQEGGSDFERAVRFFVLNRITFSGTTYSGATPSRLLKEDLRTTA
jgi:DNA adenine methylase